MWLSTLALLLILVGCTWSAVNKTVHNQHESWLYLNKYGYNLCSNSSRNVACSTDYSSMLRDFQKNHGLKMTGALDAPTKRQMNLPRCGNADGRSGAFDEFKWSRQLLTWSLRSYPRQISQARATAIVNEAFNAWSAHIPLQIKEVCSTCSADFVIDTGRYDHNCSDSFDGPGRTLAHAFFPEDGRIHFDADERWTEAFDNSGINFYLVVVHEIGHALGLEHNHNRRSIMYPAYQLFSHGSMLPDLDRESIQAMYGASKGGGGTEDGEDTKRDESTPDIFFNGTYQLVHVGSEKVLDIYGGGTDDETNVQIWPNHRWENQLWTIHQNGDGTVKVINPKSGKALDVYAARTSDGTNVQIFRDNGGDAQKWHLKSVGDGVYKLIHSSSGKALDVTGGETADGTNVQIWSQNGGMAQTWRLVRYHLKDSTQKFDPNSYYRLSTAWQADGKSLDILNDGENNKPIFAKTGAYSGQRWKITKV